MLNLYHDLEQAYSEKNLNRITAKLIDLYKNKNYETINDLARKVGDYVGVAEDSTAKTFSHLMQLYHPDRGDFYRSEIRKFFNENDQKKLNTFSHIFLLNDIEKIAVDTVQEYDEDIDYHPEYIWEEMFGDGFHTVQEEEEEFIEYPWDQNENTFFNAVKLRLYGNSRIRLDPASLLDIEEVELTDSGIENLDGLEYCAHATYLDLSRNRICDLKEMWDLIRLQDVYLADNDISVIDPLSNLVMLKNLDLSNNNIDDISTLFDLPRLGYVNLAGNPVPEFQLKILSDRGVLVVY